MMNVLFLCGVSQAGKSTTLRQSIQFLNVSNSIKRKFRENRSTPKKVNVNGKTLCIYLDSPQESRETPDEAVEYLKEKIDWALSINADLLVMAFNISEFQDQKTEACLDWIKSSGHKPASYFVYLDSNSELDIFARLKMESIKKRYNVLPKIEWTTKREQGQEFAQYIIRFL